MFVIADKIQVGLYFGEVGSETEFPLQDSFLSLQISTQVGFYVPTCRLILADRSQFLKTTGLAADGTRFRLRIATSTGFTNGSDYPFRVFAPQQAQGNEAQGYAIDGYYDCAKFFGSTVSRPYQGTSVEVLKTMAGECGLNTLTVAATADNQVWHTRNQRYAKALWDIGAKGYVDTTSCMRQIVDDAGVFRYLNVSDLKPKTGSPEFVFAGTKASDFRIFGSESVSTSGIDNYTTGYGHRLLQPRVVGDDHNLTTVEVKSDKPLLMNQIVKTGMGTQIRRSFEPVDAGNVNENYAQAVYQNERIANTWSAGSRLMVGNRTQLQCLDPVMVQYQAPGGTTPDQYRSGPHLITAKTIYITNGNYYEVHKVMRNNLNAEPGKA